jgi:hypothetical protein
MMTKISKLRSADFGDQGFLHLYFPNWPELEELHLPHVYNIPVEFIDLYAGELGYNLPSGGVAEAKTIKVIHYWRAHKPWEMPIAKMDYSMSAKGPLYFQAFKLWVRAYLDVCDSFSCQANDAQSRFV